MTSLADTKWLEKTEYKPENPGYSPGHKYVRWLLWTVQFSSVAQSGPTLYNPMNHSTPVHHQLPESTKTHIHRVRDATQPSHPLSSPSPPALNLSHHQGLFKCVSSSHQVVKVLEFQLQHQSFQWTPRPISFSVDWMDLPAVQGTLRVFSNTTVHHNSSALSFIYNPTLTSIHDYWKNHSLD